MVSGKFLHLPLLAFYSGRHWRIMPANALGTAYSPFSSARLAQTQPSGAGPAAVPQNPLICQMRWVNTWRVLCSGACHCTQRPMVRNAASSSGWVMAVPSKARGCHSPASSPLDGRRCKSTPCGPVINAAVTGTFDEMESDVHAPEAYGIYQSVGDTVGAGGFMRAMRTIPMYVTIAEAIRDYSPNAWVINYTNPMTLCVRTLYHVFPKIKAFGCCHEVFGTQTLLTHILDEELGLKDVARQDIKVNVKGINHFTWFDKATYKGMDLFPIYRKFAEEHYESGYEYGDTNWMNSSFACANRVKFDLFLRYGCIAAAGDRHLAEFMPGKTYLESPEAVREWKFGLTTVAWRKNELQERLARSRRLRTGEEPIEIKPDGEEGHLLMKALLGLGDLVSNVNIPNHGAIANLPWDAVVEVNALFSRQGVQSVNAGPLPANILPLVARHVYNQENTLTAALTCDRTLGLTTFMNDPQVTLNWKQGKELFDTMLHNTRAYLPKEWNA